MSPPYEQSEGISSSSGSHPRGWLTPAQREHSANFIGSEKSRLMADAIRDREVLGSDGIVRERPAVSLSYSQALGMIGMGPDDRILS
jgi:hypothetical protein